MQRSSYKTRINETDRGYFREIFNLHANADQKIDLEGLNKIFEMVGFVPNEKQRQEFEQCFEKKSHLNFDGFLNIFSLKSNSQFNEVDVKNAFRLLSKEYERENCIKLDRVKEILVEMGVSDLEVTQLTQ